MTKVIIGAGISGLYTAIKLRKAGVLDIVVYDPRAGHYTRPGHLNLSVFRQAEEGTGIEVWPASKTGHIKDLERSLYAKAKELGIKIENKRFIRLHEDEKNQELLLLTILVLKKLLRANMFLIALVTDERWFLQ